MRLSGTRAFALFAGAWAASIATLALLGRPVAEALFLAAILGLALPALALLVTRNLPRWSPPYRTAHEPRLLGGLLLAVVLFLAAKGQILAALLPADPDPRLAETVDAALKLVVFVLLPLAVYGKLGKRSPKALGLRWPPGPPETRRRSWLAFLVVGSALVAVQLVFGQGARPLLDGSLAGRPWVLGLLLTWVWMSLEAGLVEETFFRVVLQSRLDAVTRSELGGLFLASLLFGLAHAPGLWLRGAGAIDGLGGDLTQGPSPLLAIAYSIAQLAPAGLVFGILWLRTRNWLLIVALHGLIDALAHAAGFMERWGL